jgi:hypothetical protein
MAREKEGAASMAQQRRMRKRGRSAGADRVEVPDLSVSGDTLDLWK